MAPHTLRINTVFTSGATPGMQRFMEVLPNLKKDVWRKLHSLGAFETGYIRLARSPGKDMLFILPQTDLRHLSKYWMRTTLETGSAIILIDGTKLALHHRSLGTTPDEATLFTDSKGETFRTELVPY